MTPKRPQELKWIGKNYGDGRPVEFIHDLEPRDHSEEETSALSQDQLASARSSGLYKEVHAPEPKARKAKAEPEPEPVVDVPAAEPVTESEEG